MGGGWGGGYKKGIIIPASGGDSKRSFRQKNSFVMLLLNSSAFTGFVIYIVGEQGGGRGGGGLGVTKFLNSTHVTLRVLGSGEGGVGMMRWWDRQWVYDCMWVDGCTWLGVVCLKNISQLCGYFSELWLTTFFTLRRANVFMAFVPRWNTKSLPFGI